jgi:hypothetical protein
MAKAPVLPGWAQQVTVLVQQDQCIRGHSKASVEQKVMVLLGICGFLVAKNQQERRAFPSWQGDGAAGLLCDGPVKNLSPTQH